MNPQCSPVPVDDEAHESISLIIYPSAILVENELIPPDLGFEHEEALRNSKAFVYELHKLSQKIDKQLHAAFFPDESDFARLEEALYVSKADALSALLPLKKIGESLRAELSPNILEKLDYYGFHFRGQQESMQMALTFQEMNRAPILWEMLYETEEEQNSLPEWQRFWGFGVPITHWTDVGRIKKIRLNNGFFSAIHEGLPFAEREEQAIKRRLQQYLQHEFPHYSLRQELYHHVQQKIQKQLFDEDKTKIWWETCPGDFWLRRFVEEMEPDEEARQYLVQIWKEDILLSICKRGFTQDLIHFACHCEPNGRTEFLSQLIMQVAGEELPLDIATLVTKMRQKKTSHDDPGSLVFLNACGTAQTLTTYESPSFPVKWIKDQRALAVIATICPVPDYFAHAFALKFYEILFATEETASSDTTAGISANKYIATALLETRRYFMEKFNNPLGLAYIIYAIKDAHIQNDPLQREGRKVWP